MGKGYFEFKKFTIHQDKCGMKVCTDSCLFGALVEVDDVRSILDIGTGTGLLSLMVSQRTSSPVTALEPDENAFIQAQDNVRNSPFKNITVIPRTLQNFQTEVKFDLVICNPPFYSNYLRSSDDRYNSSTHADSLPFIDLVSSVNLLMGLHGRFYLLLPVFEFDKFTTIAQAHGLHLNKKFIVFDRPNTKPIRVIGVFSNKLSIVDSLKIYIKTIDNVYTDQFKSLLSDYYKIF